MLRITDATLTAIDPANSPTGAIRQYFEALLALGVDFAEVSPAVLPFLGAKSGCATSAREPYGSLRLSLRVNVIHDELRIIGDACLLRGDYINLFQEILDASPLPITFSAKDSGYAATALTTEWVLAGGDHIVCSFMGTGGYAPLEEVILALQVHGYELPHIDTAYLKPLGEAWQTLTGTSIPAKKPVIGKKIFQVESGVHIDGILKNTMNYEPFAPEKVGAGRAFILGKSSGKKAYEKIKASGMGSIILWPACSQEVL